MFVLIGILIGLAAGAALAFIALYALTGSRLVWFGSVGLGVVSAVLLAIPMAQGS